MTSYTQQPINTEWIHRVGYPGGRGIREIVYPGGRVYLVYPTPTPGATKAGGRHPTGMLLFGLVDDILRFASSTFLSMFLPSH